MPKRNARPGFPPEASDRCDRAVSTFFVSSRSKLPTNQSPQEESVIRSDEVASSAPAKQLRTRTARWRGVTVGVASLVAMLGTALVPALGSTPAGAIGNTVTVVTGHSGTTAPSLGVPAAAGSAQISPTYVAYNPSNGDTAVTQTKAGSVFVYLIAGGSGSESNEYMIQTAPNPSPAFGSLTSGDAYIVAGTGTAGLIAQPGNNQFGNSTTAVATANPITPTSVAFDPSGNLLIAGESGTSSAIQVVAKTTGTFYGVAMTAGDLYTVADVGVSGAPASALNMGGVAAPANGMSVDSTGNIVVGDGSGVEFVNEQASGSLTLYGQSIPAQSAAVIAGNAEGGTDCAPGATSDSASSQYFQSAAPFVDSSDNVYFSDNEAGPASGCDWVLPAQTGTLDGLSVTAGNVYKLAGNGGTTATTDGTAGVSANVAGTSEMTLDSAGNVVLAVSGAATGTSPALQVLAESSATYYGVAMTAGDIYTVAGGPSHLLATLSGPTSLLNNGGGNLLFTDGAASSANLDEFSGAPTGASLVPVVSGVSPANGPTAGGTSVTVTGTNLTGATAVAFGSNAGTSISGVTATSLTVTSPAGTGTVNVTVTTPNGTSAVNAPSDQFTYNAPALPTVTGVSPTNGPTAGGTSVIVSGTNLTGATAVAFGSNAGTSISGVTATSLTVTSPAGTGTVNVTVTTPNGTSAVNAPSDQFTYNAPALPTVTGVSPTSGLAAGGTSVIVSGTNLTGATAVDFGTAHPGTSISGVTATSLTVTSPAGTGTVNVTVTTPNGTSAVNAPSDQFTYNPLPTVTAVNPNNGPQGGTNTVTLTGSGFVSGSTGVEFGTNAGTSVNVSSGTSLTVVVPAGTGTVSVSVITTGGGSSTPLASAYTYNAPALPTVTGVSPANGPTAGGTSVTVTGTNLTGATAVAFGSNAGTSISGVTATSLTVTSPAGTGTVNVTVTTPNGTSAVNAPSDQFTYNAPALPTVTGVSPTNGPTAGGTSVIVSGTNLTGATAVAFGSNAGTSISGVTATSLTVTSPAGTGTVNVTVTTPNGTSAINAPSDQFTYNAPALPTVTGVSPTNGPTAGGTSVIVSGTNLTGATAVAFGSNAGTSISGVTATSLTVTSPAGTGTVNVTVTTPNGTSAVNAPSDQFTYNAPALPTVTGVSPANGPTAGGTSVTVTGTNLTGATAVAFGSNAGTSISGVTATSLTVTSPAGTGTVNVTVTTPNGTSAVNAPSDQFTYNAPALPTVTGVSPTSGLAAGGTSVIVSGTNLTGATAVDFGTAHPGTSISGVTATSLTVTSPAGTGTVNVTVTTPNGTSAVNAPSDQFTYNPLPTVTAVNPNNGPQGGTNTVTLTGSGFVSGSTGVEFGTNAGTSVNVSSGTSLTVVVPAGTGTVSVSVITTGGGSSTPLASAYTYNAPALPTVTGVSPANGPTAGGTSVTVTGTNLTGATAVAFGSNAGTSISGVTATSLTVTSPAGTGTVNVTVTTPNGTSAVNAPSDQFTYNAPALPTVTGVSPTNGPTAGGTSVIVSGTNLTGATAVAFGSNAGTSISGVTATSLTVTSPAGTGTVNVTVTTPNGTSAVNAPSDQFTYNAPALPTVTGVSPANGPTAGGTSVTVTGTNLTGATAVAFGSNAGTSISGVTATSLTVTSPAGTGTVNVTVTTPNGTSAVNAPSDQFTYEAAVATPENTTTSLTVPSLTFGSEGSPAAFTGTVAGPSASDGIPAGTVTVYYDYGVTGQTQLCHETLSGGSGDSVNYSCSLASATQLPAGPYTNVVASYGGGSSSNSSFSYNASTSSPQSLTVSPASTSGNNLKIQLSSPGLRWGIGGLYEIKVTNEAATATTGTLTVTDALPSGLSYRGAGSFQPGWQCAATGGTVTCTSTKAIAAGGVDYLFLVVRVSARPGTSVTDTVNLTPVGTPASNYTASVTTKVEGFFFGRGSHDRGHRHWRGGSPFGFRRG